jgi:hypothetical protein
VSYVRYDNDNWGSAYIELNCLTCDQILQPTDFSRVIGCDKCKSAIKFSIEPLKDWDHFSDEQHPMCRTDLSIYKDGSRRCDTCNVDVVRHPDCKSCHASVCSIGGSSTGCYCYEIIDARDPYNRCICPEGDWLIEHYNLYPRSNAHYEQITKRKTNE